jgi:hypothetical protein
MDDLRQRRSSPLLVAILIVAGIARIGAIVGDACDPCAAGHSATAGAVSFRRAIHLIAFGVQIMTTRHGVVVPVQARGGSEAGESASAGCSD